MFILCLQFLDMYFSFQKFIHVLKFHFSFFASCNMTKSKVFLSVSFKCMFINFISLILKQRTNIYFCKAVASSTNNVYKMYEQLLAHRCGNSVDGGISKLAVKSIWLSLVVPQTSGVTGMYVLQRSQVQVTLCLHLFPRSYQTSLWENKCSKTTTQHNK